MSGLHTRSAQLRVPVCTVPRRGGARISGACGLGVGKLNVRRGKWRAERTEWQVKSQSYGEGSGAPNVRNRIIQRNITLREGPLAARLAAGGLWRPLAAQAAHAARLAASGGPGGPLACWRPQGNPAGGPLAARWRPAWRPWRPTGGPLGGPGGPLAACLAALAARVGGPGGLLAASLAALAAFGGPHVAALVALAALAASWRPCQHCV
eukprot:gene17420-biopygen13673